MSACKSVAGDKADEIVDEMMTSARKKTAVVQSRSSFRSGLETYILAPTSHPRSRVLHASKDFVVIRDLYPKASVHLLVLPTSRAHWRLHPFEAFKDAAFSQMVQTECDKWRTVAANELARIFGWAAVRMEDVRVGVHASPSMDTLHVHVISRDMFSPSMKHAKHYNSFNTAFFTPLECVPTMTADDVRRRKECLSGNLVCWRCHRDFGRGFSALKSHLAQEYEEWKNLN